MGPGQMDSEAWLVKDSQKRYAKLKKMSHAELGQYWADRANACFTIVATAGDYTNGTNPMPSSKS